MTTLLIVEGQICSPILLRSHVQVAAPMNVVVTKNVLDHSLRGQIKKKAIIFNCDECINSIKHAQFILRNLYCVSNRVSETLFDTLTKDLRDLYRSKNELFISKFATRTSELERTIMLIITSALNNIDVSAKSIIVSNNNILKKQLELDASNMLSDFLAYATPLINALIAVDPTSDPEVIAALEPLISNVTGAIPTLRNLLLTFGSATDLAIETSKSLAKAAIGSAINDTISITTLSILNAFRIYLSDVKTMIGNDQDAVSADLFDLISKTEKALLCSLENFLLGNFKIIDHLVRRCIEIVNLRKVDQKDVFPIIPHGGNRPFIPMMRQ